MATMAVHITMTRSGFWPEHISAAAWGMDNAVLIRTEVLVRPRDGEKTITTPQAVADRDGMEGDDVRCALRLIGGRSKDAWTGMVKVSRMLIVHGIDETDRCIKLARAEFGMSPEWRRPAMRLIDTLQITRTLMGVDRFVPADEAAMEFTGQPARGVEALVAIFNHPEAARVWRAA
jgi:hypothetical protein